MVEASGETGGLKDSCVPPIRRWGTPVLLVASAHGLLY